MKPKNTKLICNTFTLDVIYFCLYNININSKGIKNVILIIINYFENLRSGYFFYNLLVRILMKLNILT